MDFPISIPFVDDLGLVLHTFGDGQAELRLMLQPRLLNSWQVAHGGVLMTMLDVAMAHAARSSEPGATPAAPGQRGPGPGVATVEMKTSFVRPAEGELRAVGKLLHRTATLAFCEASVLDLSSRLCAHATGTFKFVRRLKRDSAAALGPGTAGVLMV